MTDDELVSLARQGDTGAFDQLVVRHQVAVYRAALESGKTLVVSQTSSAISNRKMRGEVTATILE